MKKIRPLTHLAIGAAATAALHLAGCASTPSARSYTSNPAWGAGTHVLMAQHLIQDASALGKARQTGSSPVTDIGYAATNLASAGIAMPAAAATSALSLLMPGPNDPRGHSQVLAWLPADIADSPAEALAQIKDIVHEALRAALDEALPAPYRAVPMADPGMFRITGGACNQRHMNCSFRAFVGVEPSLAAAPDFLSPGRTWTWAERSGRARGHGGVELPRTALNSTHFPGQYETLFDDLAVYQAMSAHLPEGMYLYLAPGMVSLGPERGWLAEPLVLHRGSVLPISS